jgi:hypothetical protein
MSERTRTGEDGAKHEALLRGTLLVKEVEIMRIITYVLDLVLFCDCRIIKQD